MTRSSQLSFVKVLFVKKTFSFSKNEIMTNFLSLSDNLGYTFKKSSVKIFIKIN